MTAVIGADEASSVGLLSPLCVTLFDSDSVPASIGDVAAFTDQTTDEKDGIKHARKARESHSTCIQP